MAEEIRAEMVANVWKIQVQVGDEVADGDTLVILESMKMEIPVFAEAAGKVTRIEVTEGEVVQEGHLIVVIDDKPQDDKPQDDKAKGDKPKGDKPKGAGSKSGVGSGKAAAADR